MEKRKRTFENRLDLVRFAVKNINEERIKNAVAKFGITEEHFKQGEELLDNVDQTELEFIEKNRLYYRAVEKFNNTYEELKPINARHISFCRLLLKDTPGIIEKLTLKGRRPRAFLPWLEVTKQFYTSALDDSTVISALKAHNITRKELANTLKDLENLEELNRVKNIRKEERRETNIKLYEALKIAEKWRQKIIVFAKEGLGKDSKLLIALGVKVKG